MREPATKFTQIEQIRNHQWQFFMLATPCRVTFCSPSASNFTQIHSKHSPPLIILAAPPRVTFCTPSASKFTRIQSNSQSLPKLAQMRQIHYIPHHWSQFIILATPLRVTFCILSGSKFIIFTTFTTFAHIRPHSPPFITIHHSRHASSRDLLHLVSLQIHHIQCIYICMYIEYNTNVNYIIY